VLDFVRHAIDGGISSKPDVEVPPPAACRKPAVRPLVSLSNTSPPQILELAQLLQIFFAFQFPAVGIWFVFHDVIAGFAGPGTSRSGRPGHF
jgi:hypothetical protein